MSAGVFSLAGTALGTMSALNALKAAAAGDDDGEDDYSDDGFDVSCSTSAASACCSPTSVGVRSERAGLTLAVYRHTSLPLQLQPLRKRQRQSFLHPKWPHLPRRHHEEGEEGRERSRRVVRAVHRRGCAALSPSFRPSPTLSERSSCARVCQRS